MAPQSSSKAAAFVTIATIILLPLAVAIGFLVGPRVPDAEQADYCVSNFHIAGPFGHSLACDSAEFLIDAETPSNLMKPDSVRQGRPGASTFVHFLALPLVPLKQALFPDVEIERNLDPSGKRKNTGLMEDKARYIPYYAAFLAFHVMILLGSFALYLYAIGLPVFDWRTYTFASACVGVLLLANNISKQFFWSPHTQLFNILVPAAMVAGARWLAETGKRNPAYWVLAFCFGVGQLFYGIFMVGIVVLGMQMVWMHFRDHGISIRSLLSLLPPNLIAILLFGLPYGAWYAYVISVNGDFFQYDVEHYNFVVWIVPYYQEGGLAAAAWEIWIRIVYLWQLALEQGWVFVAVLMLSAVLCAVTAKDGRFGSADGFVIASCIIYLALTTLFYSVYGLVVYRLAFSVVIPVFILIGLLVRRMERGGAKPLLNFAVCLSTIAYGAWLAIKFGPYS